MSREGWVGVLDDERWFRSLASVSSNFGWQAIPQTLCTQVPAITMYYCAVGNYAVESTASGPLLFLGTWGST